MGDVQDPIKQVGYIQQCLSSDKMPIGIFIGAGCPMAVRGDAAAPPLIPDIAGITKVVRQKLSESAGCAPLLKIVEAHFTKDGRTDVNIEHILSHIRALRAVAGAEEVRNLSAENLDLLDHQICDIIHELADKSLPGSETPYHRLASWVEAVGREKPVEIFTTNYDLLMEQALEDCHVPYFDGFAGSNRPFFDLRAMEEDKLPPRWARLWKVHGSINWYQTTAKGVFRGGTRNEQGSKRVIHPSHLKYEESRRLPYLAMIDRLRAFLKQPTAVLVLCGYSFRDDHLNEVIVQGLQYTQTAIAFALLHGNIAKYTQATKLACERSNLSLLAPDGAVISGRQGKWPVKDAEVAETEAIEWVKWLAVDPAREDSKRTAQLQLGDFAVFGLFLRDLVGHSRLPQEFLNAK
ncbi:MAG: SIR2 family protein [Spirochaetia bacterium]|jgi:hypothetical protein